MGNGLIEEYLRPSLEEKTDILFVVTNKDNINLMIAQKAKRRFEIDRVIARVDDSHLARLYKQELGLETICPTDLVIKTLLDLL